MEERQERPARPRRNRTQVRTTRPCHSRSGAPGPASGGHPPDSSATLHWPTSECLESPLVQFLLGRCPLNPDDRGLRTAIIPSQEDILSPSAGSSRSATHGFRSEGPGRPEVSRAPVEPLGRRSLSRPATSPTNRHHNEYINQQGIQDKPDRISQIILKAHKCEHHC